MMPVYINKAFICAVTQRYLSVAPTLPDRFASPFPKASIRRASTGSDSSNTPMSKQIPRTFNFDLSISFQGIHAFARHRVPAFRASNLRTCVVIVARDLAPASSA